MSNNTSIEIVGGSELILFMPRHSCIFNENQLSLIVLNTTDIDVSFNHNQFNEAYSYYRTLGVVCANRETTSAYITEK